MNFPDGKVCELWFEDLSRVQYIKELDNGKLFIDVSTSGGKRGVGRRQALVERIIEEKATSYSFVNEYDSVFGRSNDPRVIAPGDVLKIEYDDSNSPEYVMQLKSGHIVGMYPSDADVFSNEVWAYTEDEFTDHMDRKDAKIDLVDKEDSPFKEKKTDNP